MNANAIAFDNAFAEKYYHLSIQLDGEHVTVAVHDIRFNCYVLLEQLALHTFKTQIQSLKLDCTFNEVFCLICETESTIVPDALFDPTKVRAYLTLNVGDAINDVNTDTLRNLHGKHIYAIKESKNTILECFKNVQFRHIGTCLIENLVVEHKNDSAQVIYVNSNSANINIVYLASGKLEFFNTFEYTSIEDIAYYILLCCDKFGAAGENHDLILLGQHAKNEALIVLLEKYVRNVNKKKLATTFVYSEKLTQIDTHGVYALLNQYKCG